ncbi:MAG: hypothetical protein A2Y97_12385 [Nitrospirae bacterium RBG_13_39_12]|nr:MAG: hypothetical protein A2Y97_12385 [Nitrospirae bacterium RBG_13_39_12]
MIIPPYIFSKIQRKTFFANTSFGGKSPFQISLETFKAIYVIALLVRVISACVINRFKNI